MRIQVFLFAIALKIILYVISCKGIIDTYDTAKTIASEYDHYLIYRYTGNGNISHIFSCIVEKLTTEKIKENPSEAEVEAGPKVTEVSVQTEKVHQCNKD